MNTVHYLCGVDYQHEMEEGTATMYKSLYELKRVARCWEQCGIVRLTLDPGGKEVSHEWIEEQNLYETK